MKKNNSDDDEILTSSEEEEEEEEVEEEESSNRSNSSDSENDNGDEPPLKKVKPWTYDQEIILLETYSNLCDTHKYSKLQVANKIFKDQLFEHHTVSSITTKLGRLFKQNNKEPIPISSGKRAINIKFKRDQVLKMIENFKSKYNKKRDKEAKKKTGETKEENNSNRKEISGKSQNKTKTNIVQTINSPSTTTKTKTTTTTTTTSSSSPSTTSKQNDNTKDSHTISMETSKIQSTSLNGKLKQDINATTTKKDETTIVGGGVVNSNGVNNLQDTNDTITTNGDIEKNREDEIETIGGCSNSNSKIQETNGTAIITTTKEMKKKRKEIDVINNNDNNNNNRDHIHELNSTITAQAIKINSLKKKLQLLKNQQQSPNNNTITVAATTTINSNTDLLPVNNDTQIIASNSAIIIKPPPTSLNNQDIYILFPSFPGCVTEIKNIDIIDDRYRVEIETNSKTFINTSFYHIKQFDISWYEHPQICKIIYNQIENNGILFKKKPIPTFTID